ncbi:MAG: AsmA family protein [Hydrogenophilales bacterium]|nr:AsmA family protein [Hydrogenophilales bacterium]
MPKYLPQYFKYALFGVAGLIALFALLLAVVAFTVDPNAFKPQIVKLVQEKKQRTLSIDGDIKLKLFPKLGVDLGKTRLSEHKSTQEFAALESVKLFVAWLPLLKKELVVDKISVEGVRANLIRYADGSTNIDDLLSKEESEQVKFDIEGVKIKRGALSFDDRMAKRKLGIAEFEMESGRLKDNTHTDIELDFKVTGDHPSIAARVKVKSGLLFALEEKHYALDGLNLKLSGEAVGVKNLELSAKGDIDAQLKAQAFSLKDVKLDLKGNRAADKLDIALNAPKLILTESRAEGSKLTLEAKIEQANGKLTATLTLPDLAGNAKQFNVSQLSLEIDGKQGDNRIQGKLTSPFAGSLDAQTFHLPKLAANLDVANPRLPKGGMKLALSGDARADLAKQQVAANLNTKLDDSTIQAKLGMNPFSNPHFNFDINIDQLDVDRYLPPKGKAEQSQPESPIDLSGLKSLNASGSVRIGQLKVANLKSSNVRLELKAGAGRVEMNPLSANLYQGAMKGALSATTSASPKIAVQQNLTGISIGPLLKDLADKDLLDGRGNVSLNVTTQGATASAMKKALNGSAAVNLQDGAIKGINIASTLRNAKAKLGMQSDSQTQSASASEKTDFSELKASFAINNGVAHNDDLSAKSPLLRLAGNGDINIGAGSMDYVAKATVVGSLEGQGGKELSQLKGVTVPVRVTGPFDALKYKVDVGALATESAKAKLEEKKTEVKEKAKEKVQEKLKGLFGR